ncbi:MAG: hypothetical protein XXXJIFNMEKO3_02958 [Candidatus Erwinia impunctatus]|nr:hypothetical protein XXXJIFNMEKO_02958 [Culicoides impunctatus]
MRKRFIAGAICPACQHSDTLAYWFQDNRHHAECAHCGHSVTETMEKTPEAFEKLAPIARFRTE